MIWHMEIKDVGDVDSLSNSIHGKIYQIMDFKKTDYVMIMMTSYGTLENLGGLVTQKRYKLSGRELSTKRFNYCEGFSNQFHYRHEVEDNKKFHHCPISVENTWAKTYCSDC